MIKDRLPSIRLKRGLTQQDLADKMYLSVNTISNYERGIRQPSLDILVELCKVLEVSTDYMLGVI